MELPRCVTRRNFIVVRACALIAAAAAFIGTRGDVSAQAPALKPPVIRSHTNDWIRLDGVVSAATPVVNVLASSNLVDWETIAVLHGNSFGFLDPASSHAMQRFYRFEAAPLTPTNDWKNQVQHPYDSFRALGGSAQAWIKFAIPMANPTRVFYADSLRFAFHYDLVTQRVEPFVGISPAAFDAIAQYNTNRQLVLGSLLFPGYPRTEYGIQFVSRDPLPRETVRDLFRLVKSTVVPDPNEPEARRAFYIPTFEQMTGAESDAAFFASNGIPVSTADRWSGDNICYSEGWAVGMLKFFHATNVPAAYADGRLRPQDILITDGIPAELPYVSGIITLAATTPNSHVAILAQSYHVPFTFLLDPAERARVLQWTNREIVLQTGIVSGNGGCTVLILPVEPELDAATRAELLAIKAGPAFKIAPKEHYGAYTASTDGLVPTDIRFFGGKAANYGVLRRSIPSNSYPAIAISFDLWDEFMDQSLGNGRTLRQEISNRLAGFTYPPDVAALQLELAGIRNLIRNTTQFTPAQIQAITNALTVFDRYRNIRFRSSTNVEDAESFSGAGLYESFSGCLADDLDGDTSGPSLCDATENNERGVFRAIRRVYSSFYNDNAYLERMRLGVDPGIVGMAVLVHHSTPDDIELANGVATATWRRDNGEFHGVMVSQLGATSVANPDGTAAPEEVDFAVHGELRTELALRKSSSLVRLGESVMQWDADYRTLAGLLAAAGNGYGAIVTNKDTIRLDLEYKKVAPGPGTLEVKQIREVPMTTNRYVAPFVLNDPDATFTTWQGYYANIFMAHRLKSRWRLQHRSIPFTATNLAEGFYTHASIEYLNGTNVQTISGPLDTFSGYEREVFSSPWTLNGTLEDGWTMSTDSGPMSFALRTTFSAEAESRSPFRTIPETQFYGMELGVGFSAPVRLIDVFGAVEFATNHLTSLYRLRPENSNDLHVEMTFEIPGQGTTVKIQTSLWFPEEARGDDCRCPVLRFVETRVEGLTSEPLVLRGFWSQTFSDIHTRDFEQLILEPRLEEGLSAAQANELAAADIAQIYVNRNGGPAVLMIIGLDGEMRQFSDVGLDDD